MSAPGSHSEAADDRNVAAILEDNAAVLLPLLTNPTGDPGEGHVEEKVVFSGRSSVRIVPMQRFNNLIPGWDYRIRETPAAGEYRYLRFAWRAPRSSGVMLQLHDTDWHIRYTAGSDKYGWGTKFVAEKPPAEWKLTTIDLWKDFGDRNLRGIALTAFDCESAWFDHIYFGRSVADLDAIDATGLKRDGSVKLSEEELEQHCRQLTATDDAQAYLSFWTLVAAGAPIRSALLAKVDGDDNVPDAAQFPRWITELDAEEFDARERATRQLKLHFGAAESLLQAALENKPSAEARFRLEQILKSAGIPPTEEDQRLHKIRRILAEMRPTLLGRPILPMVIK